MYADILIFFFIFLAIPEYIANIAKWNQREISLPDDVDDSRPVKFRVYFVFDKLIITEDVLAFAGGFMLNYCCHTCKFVLIDSYTAPILLIET